MLMHIQWTTHPASNYLPIDSSQWTKLAKKPAPPFDRRPVFEGEAWLKSPLIAFDGPDLTIDAELGWPWRLSIQGLGFAADHLHVYDTIDSTVVTAWYDRDYVDSPEAEVWRLYDEIVERTYADPINPKIDIHCNGPLQIKTIYSDRPQEPQISSGGLVEVLPWSMFVPPPEEETRHQVWVTQDIADALDAFPQPTLEDWLHQRGG